MLKISKNKLDKSAQHFIPYFSVEKNLSNLPYMVIMIFNTFMFN